MEDEELEPTVETIAFKDLSSSLQDDVIQNFQSDEFLIPDQWYDWLWDDFIENMKSESIYVDSTSLTFDMNYGSNVEYTGNIGSSEKTFTDMKSEELEQYESDEWVYDLPESFDHTGLDDSYDIQTNVIYEEIEAAIFPDVEINEDGQIEIPYGLYENIMKQIKKYDLQDEDFVKDITAGFEAAQMFFQTMFLLDEYKFNDFIQSATNDIENNIESNVDDYISQVDTKLESLKDNFAKDLSSQYDYYYTEEYAKENLENKTFEVTMDEDGEQDFIEDLDGEW